MAVALVLAHLNAYGGYVGHMGWEVSDWTVARNYAAKVVARYVGVENPRPEERPQPATGLSLWVP